MLAYAPYRAHQLGVLVAVASFAHPHGGDAWPSISALAHLARITPRHAQRLLRDCEATNPPALRIDTGAGPRGVNRYMLPFAAWGLRWDERRRLWYPGPSYQGMTPASPVSAVTPDTHVTGGVTPLPPDPSLIRHFPSEIRQWLTDPANDDLRAAETARALAGRMGANPRRPKKGA